MPRSPTTAPHRVPDGTPPARLDRYAAGVFGALASTKQAKRTAKAGGILVNGQPAESSRFVRPGDHVELVELVIPRPRVHERELVVVHEDDAHAVIVKPPGLAVSGNRHFTVEHALPHNLQSTPAADALAWPRPVHRLDVRTGGLLLVAKTASAAAALGGQFERREIRKVYRAIAVGRLDGEGRVERPVEDRAAITDYRAVEHTRSLHCRWLTTVELRPRTGRTHQLRRHLAHLGHPVLGDDLYGIEGTVLRRAGLFLWALELGWADPCSGDRRNARLDEPYKFAATRRREQRRWEHVSHAAMIPRGLTPS